jgi:uncharacterized membrane protein YgcG
MTSSLRTRIVTGVATLGALVALTFAIDTSSRATATTSAAVSATPASAQSSDTASTGSSASTGGDASRGGFSGNGSSSSAPSIAPTNAAPTSGTS